MSILAATAPSEEVVEAPEGAEGAEGGEGTSTVSDVVASDLADDTMLEVTDSSGNKQVISLKDLRETYVERDRHRAAADRKFTEADKLRKGVQGEVARAIDDPNSFLTWLETQKPDFKTVDFFFEQLERNGDTQVIDRLAALLEKKLLNEEQERALSPADKRVRELEAKLKEREDAWEAEQDYREEKYLFDNVQGAIGAAGLNPTPLVTVMALEIVSEARMKGIELTPQQAANILKEQVGSAAEKLFKSDNALPPRASDGKFQSSAKVSPGTADSGAGAAAKRAAKSATVVKGATKKKEEPTDNRMSFLDAVRDTYRSGSR